MLRLLLILISSVFLCSNSNPKPPVVVLSKKIEMDRIVGEVKYEGAVRIDFTNYNIVTNKMTIKTISDSGVTKISHVTFPEKANIVSKDNKEVITINKGLYIAETGTISADGDIKIEKDGQLFSTQHIEIQLGESKGITQLWQ